jgi:hypothetical protein
LTAELPAADDVWSTPQSPSRIILAVARRQHGVPILAALAHLDTDQHALGIDVADRSMTTSQPRRLARRRC